MAKRRMSRIAVRWALRAVGTGLGVVAVVSALGTWAIFEKERSAARAARAAEVEHHELIARRAALEANLGALDTPRGVEAAIRERYPVVRPGEGVITLVDAPPVAAATTSPPTGIWDSVRNWLGL